MNPVVACIVEGHGEREAVPLLVRRIAESLPTPVYVDAPRAIRVPKTRLVRPGELEQATRLAMLRGRVSGRRRWRAGSDRCGRRLCGAVWPGTSGTGEVGGRCYSRRGRAGGEGVRGVVSGCADVAEGPARHPGRCGGAAQPGVCSRAKEALRRQMTPGSAYSPPTDQPALAAIMDLDAARAAPSFDKLRRAVAGILSAHE